MDLKLEGKLALVSGSTAGIGYAIATALAAEGARVIVNGRSQGSVDDAVARIKPADGGEVLGFAGDLSTPAAAEALVARYPGIEILVNNLGIFEPKPFEDIPDADWMRFFDVNVLSGVRLARLCLPAMKRANWGRIIFISSESAVQIPAEMIHYGMTKTAQLAVARGLAESLAGTGHHRQQRPARPDEVARCWRLRRCARQGRRQVLRCLREGVLREGAPDLPHQALRIAGGGRRDGGLHCEPVVVGNDRCGAARRWGMHQERVLGCGPRFRASPEAWRESMTAAEASRRVLVRARVMEPMANFASPQG